MCLRVAVGGSAAGGGAPKPPRGWFLASGIAWEGRVGIGRSWKGHVGQGHRKDSAAAGGSGLRKGCVGRGREEGSITTGVGSGEGRVWGTAVRRAALRGKNVRDTAAQKQDALGMGVWGAAAAQGKGVQGTATRGRHSEA